ncbi:hypothetical protein AB0C69_38820, partial [Actinomadura sp. NPDC048032]|uniref:hypothetical protein n=1 Tax=Actinomadura sp. NPDC048032 TaxID=3155747 RepID=UPI00340981C7
AWAIAVCIDLTCVMAAAERQRDKNTGRDTGRLTWPTVVLVGGILLSLAANLAQAHPSVWGWITAGTPAGAFLVAVSMLERRKAGTPAAHTSPVPEAFGRPDPAPVVSSASSSGSSSPSSPWVVWEDEHSTLAAAAVPGPQDEPRDREEQDGQISIPVPAEQSPAAPSAPPSASSSSPGAAGPLVDFARRVASEHESRHGRPITRDALRARLGVSNQLASDLLRQLRTEQPHATASVS